MLVKVRVKKVVLNLSHIRYFFALVLCFLLLSSFIVSTSALSITPYRSLSANDTTSLNLYAFYSNSEYFNPLNDYVIVRSSQYDYILIVYLSSEECITFTYNSTSGSYSVGSVFHSDQIHITSNEYSYLGSVPGSLRSSNITSYQSDHFSIFVLLFILILFLLYIFRSTFNPFRSKGGSIRL